MHHPPIDQQITFVYTDDLEASVHFYETVLGLRLWKDQGTCRIYQITDTSLIGVCQTGPSAKGTIQNTTQNNVILTLVTEVVDEWYHYLSDRGIEFEKPPEVNEKYQIYHCFLRDPNGYLIELQRFLS